MTIPAATHATFIPIPLDASSFNQDVVVEASAPAKASATTATMDDGIFNTSTTWYEVGYNPDYPDSGLPAAGTTITSLVDANYSYTFAPSYTTNNAILLDSSVFPSATFTFTTPSVYRTLSLLTSGGNGGITFQYTAAFEDGSTQEGMAKSADWFSGANYAYSSRGRVNAQTYEFDSAASLYSQYNPRLYSRDISITNTTSRIVSLTLAYSSGDGHTCFMAVSGQSDPGGAFVPIDVTGYNADIVVEADALPANYSLGAYVTLGIDDANNAWFEQGYYRGNTNLGLPKAGSRITNSVGDHVFVLPSDYSVNNAIVGEDTSTSTVIFTNPATYGALSFLTASGTGATVNDLVIHHQNGNTETGSFVSPDWFNNTPYIFATTGNVNLDNADFSNLDWANPRLYYKDVIVLDKSPIIQIDITTYAQNPADLNARGVVFAISGDTSSAPVINDSPQNLITLEGQAAAFSVTLRNTDTYDYQWQKLAGVVFTNLTNDTNWSGVTSQNLTLASAALTDGTDYRVIVSNTYGAVTSTVAHLTVRSSLQPVTVPGDGITAFGGSSPAGEIVSHAIDGLTSKYLNYGTNNGNPFAGPVGFIVTPGAGPTRVTVVRFYTANDSPPRDPADFTLYGSNDGGNTFTTIAYSLLALPDARNTSGAYLDPLSQNLQEVFFTNNASYKTYKLSIQNVKNNGGANSMQIGEVQLLGVTAPINAVLSAKVNSDHSITISTTAPGTLQSTTNLNGTAAQWTDEVSIETKYVITPDLSAPAKFYRVLAQ